uniref:CHK kinase-like domain-containing protein n=1 Tax=Acrobeloides nanus TaxID=290746 RepID=A0A914BXX2_9BILA
MPVKCLPNLLNEQVSTTGLTYEWILTTLSKHDPTFDQILNGNEVTSITAYDISVNQGYASKIYKTSILVNDQKDPVYQVVMKIPTADCISELMDQMYTEDQKAQMKFMAKMTDQLSKFHNVECDFYALFKGNTELPMPKVYYTQKFYPKEKQMGIIIMEDLSEKGQTLGIYATLHAFQIKTIVKNLAAFHAFQLANEDNWKNRFTELAFIDEEFKDMVKPTIDSLKKCCPGMFDEAFKRTDKFFNEMSIVEYTFRGCCKDLERIQPDWLTDGA